jgi:hypothetical protein
LTCESISAQSRVQHCCSLADTTKANCDQSGPKTCQATVDRQEGRENKYDIWKCTINRVLSSTPNILTPAASWHIPTVHMLAYQTTYSYCMKRKGQSSFSKRKGIIHIHHRSSSCSSWSRVLVHLGPGHSFSMLQQHRHRS